MKRPTLGVLAAVLWIAGCCLCRPDPPAGPPDKYAVLASTYMAESDNVQNNSDFWLDLVLTYCTLVQHDFDGDNIFTLYGKGVDRSSTYEAYDSPYCDGQVTTITDFPLWKTQNLAKDNLCNVLCCLSTGRPATLKGGDCECLSHGNSGIGGFKCSGQNYDIPRLGKKDFLFAWIKSHGVAASCDANLEFLEGYYLEDKELKGLLENLKADRWVLMLENCAAGGFIDEFQGNQNSVVVVSSGDPDNEDITNCLEKSYPATYLEDDANLGMVGIEHGRFTYWMNAAFRQQDLVDGPVISDADQNNLVSMLEDFDATRDRIEAENQETDPEKMADLGGDMHPGISSRVGISPCVFIRLPLPGNDHDAFSMDHDDDDGTVPSTGPNQIPYESPDVWLSNPTNGSVIESPVDAGTTYNVNARAYNIGCADPGPVDVYFFSPKLADCDDPSKWGPHFGQDVIPNLPVGEFSEAHASWTPEQGRYCLIVQLAAPVRDEPNEDAVSLDNNKAQIKVEVVPVGGL